MAHACPAIPSAWARRVLVLDFLLRGADSNGVKATMITKFPLFLALLWASFLSSISHAQIGPLGAVHVQQPSGVHYFFGSIGSNAGGAFSYINYLTGHMILSARLGQRVRELFCDITGDGAIS